MRELDLFELSLRKRTTKSVAVGVCMRKVWAPFLLIAISVPAVANSDSNRVAIDRSKAEHAVLMQDLPALKGRRSKEWPTEFRERAELGFKRTALEWSECVIVAADVFSALSETAQTIADAAVAECRDWRMAYQVWFGTYLQSLGTISTARQREQAQLEMEAQLHADALTLTMRRRLAETKAAN